MARTVADKLICAARAGWYSVYEPVRLRLARSAGFDPCPDPLVSIVVPTYNRADLLIDRCLKSVLAQTYTNLEIIVADHSSTDDTAGRVAALGDARLRLLRVPRQRRYPATAENHWLMGPTDPINAGLKAARGQWIARIDDDDEWTPDHIEILLRFAQRGNYEFVSSAYVKVHDAASSRYVVAHDGVPPLIGGVQTWLYRSYLNFMRCNPDCWRKTWNRGNDTDLADRFRKAGVRIGWTPDRTAIVKARPGERFIGSKAYLANKAKTEQFYKF